MRVEDKPYKLEVRFGNIGLGSVFQHNGTTWLKTKISGIADNAVDLRIGIHHSFQGNESVVYRPDAVLTFRE